MFELFKAELLRFRMWALALGCVHFVALGFLTRMVDLAQQPLVIHWSFGATYAALGLLLGLYQMGTYRKPNAWLNLLHRPLSSSRIAISLIVAAVALLAAAIAVPILLIGVWQETMTPRVVDLRHWLLPLAALQIACAGYLVGAYGMLGERRYSAAGLVFLLLLISAKAQGFGALALQALVLVWLMTMVLHTFKPDLDAPPRTVVGIVTVALPLQMAMYLLLLLAYFGVEMLWIAQGSHPNNTPAPPRGGHNEAEKVDARTRMRMALDGSRHPDAPLLREQIALSEPTGIASQVRRLPLRFELANVMPMEFDDAARGVRWVFSHDDMRLHGYRLNDRTPAGTLGIGADNAAFPLPALPTGAMPGFAKGDAMLVAGNTAYHYGSESGQVLPRVRLPDDEVLVGASPVGETLGVISDRALYFFDGREALEHQRVMTPRLRVPMPGRYHDIYDLDMIELVDGYLIVFSNSYDANSVAGAVPYQYVLRVRDGGTVETIARRRLAYDFPAVYRYRSFWTSPGLSTLNDRALHLFAPPLPLETTVPAPVPGSMWLLAGMLSLLSVIGALWRTRRLALSATSRVAWTVPPALASLWLMHRPVERFTVREPSSPTAVAGSAAIASPSA
jgi:hypothetical protein